MIFYLPHLNTHLTGQGLEENLKEKPVEIPFSAHSFRKKITEAHNLFALWGEALWRDPRIVSLLKSLEAKIAASAKVARDFGVLALCRDCSDEDGESCCGAGIENKYTSRLLLINLLLGVTLPEKRFWSKGCFFLSEKGCGLKMRQVLCVNYLCLKIQRMLPLDKLVSLQQITGEEMDTGFLLQEAVQKFIGGKLRSE